MDTEQEDPEGRLGVTVGTVVVIEARIVRAEKFGHPNHIGRYLLQVLKVNGAKTSKKPTFMYAVRGSAIDRKSLPDDIFDLYKLKTGKNAEELEAHQIAFAEKGYVGQVMTFLAAEAGHPGNDPDPDPFGEARHSHLLLFKKVEPTG